MRAFPGWWRVWAARRPSGAFLEPLRGYSGGRRPFALAVASADAKASASAGRWRRPTTRPPLPGRTSPEGVPAPTPNRDGRRSLIGAQRNADGFACALVDLTDDDFGARVRTHRVFRDGDAHHFDRAAQHVASVAARERRSMPLLDRLDGKPFPAKDMHIVRPTRPRMVDWRSAFVASRDERRERAQAKRPLKDCSRPSGSERMVMFRTSDMDGLQRIARKLGDDASVQRRQAETAREDACGAGDVDRLMVVGPRVRPGKQRQGFGARTASGNAARRAMMLWQSVTPQPRQRPARWRGSFFRGQLVVRGVQPQAALGASVRRRGRRSASDVL
jgi:hypothetical protein